ncbi:MAG: zinc ribbon domain-containing protein [candidate division WOR-3 bacterium]|nr:zinc ribbon domain-containing protein [candidate division WOR-3 bacterium]MCX7786032.1 zinc ribbon domain-containing protein [candidate division WOR-3 bacterium]MDW7987772.1 zinc ribbon domain-containing protein [candidate division WOR-3 bacterium]
MPTYEYQCTTCNYQFEEFQKITDKPLKKCPKCGNNLKRLISPGAGFIFKGTGFYITDYKRKNNSTDKENESKSNKQT